MTNRKDIAETEADNVLRDFANLAHVSPMQVAAVAFLHGWTYGLKDAQRIHREESRPRCADCNAPLPGGYGTVGVALARTRNVLLCSNCGVREALRHATTVHLGALDRE